MQTRASLGASGTASSKVSELLRDRRDSRHPAETTLLLGGAEQIPKHHIHRWQLREKVGSLTVYTKLNIF